MAHLQPAAGGIYQYSLTMLHALHEHACQHGGDDEFVVFSKEPFDDVRSTLNSRQWTWVRLRTPLVPRAVNALMNFVGEGPHREAWRWLRRRVDKAGPPAPVNPDAVRYQPAATRFFRGYGVDVMLYASPNELAFEAKIPSIMPIHDLQHRLQPEFLEVSANGEWEMREYLFRNAARHAQLLLADSEVGREDILNCYGEYGVTPDRIRVVPFLPACYLAADVPAAERQRVRAAFDLPPRYLFYPAQFWLHKNHGRIVQALGALKQRYGAAIPIVLCGSHSGDNRERVFREAMDLVAQYGLQQDVRYLGFVPDADMSALYAEAVALVMPTFFGPTNIPILEAWACGCPVLTSDIRGIREQSGDGALLVDPRSVEAIAEGIWQLWSDEALRAELAACGRRRLASYTPADYRHRITEALETVKARLAAESRAPASSVNAEPSRA